MATAVKSRTKAKAKTSTKKAAVKRTVPTKVDAKTVASESNPQIVERGLKMIKPLHDAGIPVSISTRGPDGKATFSISKANGGLPGSIMMWPGSNSVDVTINADKKLKQAVITVKEEARTIVHKATLRSNSDRVWRGSYRSYDAVGPDTRPLTLRWPEYDTTARALMPVALPSSAVFKILSQKNLRDKNNKEILEVTVQAKVPRSEVCFLVGVDESSVFIAQLKKTVNTVTEAHAELRPAGVPESALRHGEWFFVPANKTELRAIGTREGSRRALESGSTHSASQLVTINSFKPSRTYAKGVIKDSRVGHHKDLELENWHRVVRNNEAVVVAKQRRWD